MTRQFTGCSEMRTDVQVVVAKVVAMASMATFGTLFTVGALF